MKKKKKEIIIINIVIVENEKRIKKNITRFFVLAFREISGKLTMKLMALLVIFT